MSWLVVGYPRSNEPMRLQVECKMNTQSDPLKAVQILSPLHPLPQLSALKHRGPRERYLRGSLGVLQVSRPMHEGQQGREYPEDQFHPCGLCMCAELVRG